jgi:hypothetical protein
MWWKGHSIRNQNNSGSGSEPISYKTWVMSRKYQGFSEAKVQRRDFIQDYCKKGEEISV